MVCCVSRAASSFNIFCTTYGLTISISPSSPTNRSRVDILCVRVRFISNVLCFLRSCDGSRSRLLSRLRDSSVIFRKYYVIKISLFGPLLVPAKFTGGYRENGCDGRYLIVHHPRRGFRLHIRELEIVHLLTSHRSLRAAL